MKEQAMLKSQMLVDSVKFKILRQKKGEIIERNARDDGRDDGEQESD